MNKSLTDSEGRKLPPMKCPTCAYEMDAATEIRGDHRPRIGDLALCVNCGEILELIDGFRLQVATLTALMTLSPRQHHDIEAAQKLIRCQERKS